LTPFLSVLMPTYRGARFIHAALSSIDSDDSSDVEVIVVDDGSDDETLAIADAFRDRISIRIVDGPRQRNWVASTNRALEHARGSHACLLHQDDAWVPGRLQAIRSAFATTPDATLFVHPTRFIDEDGRPVGLWRTPFSGNETLAPADVIASLLVQNWIAIPAPAFRVSDVRAIGGLDESLWYTADWNLWLELAKRGPTSHHDAVLASFRIHGDSQTVTRSRDVPDFRAQMVTVLERHLGDPLLEHAGRSAIERAARFSIETNVALASMAHRTRVDWRAFGSAAVSLDPSALALYVRDSRITDRLTARVRGAIRRRLAR